MEKTCREALDPSDWEVHWAQNGLIGLEEMSVNEYEVAIVDDSLPLLTSSELIRRISDLRPVLPVLAVVDSDERRGQIMSDFGSGLFSYLEKPFSLERLRKSVEEAYDYREFVMSQKKEMRAFFNMTGCENIVGRSSAMLRIYEVLFRIANTDVTVAIYGESGTGKELAARFLHFSGTRGEKPFVAVNCAAIPHELLESELFGHEKGAFTGAGERKSGKFEVANKGTLFLDEIGDMSLPLQAKILKVMERGEFERVGGTKTIEVDVRLISATNQNLEKMIKNGEFRADLYHRINVFPIFLPPLSRRRDDIPLLSYDILSKTSQRHRKESVYLKADALEFLTNRTWEGNVRELEHTIERAVLMTDKSFLGAEDFQFPEVETRETYQEPSASSEHLYRGLSPDRKPLTLKAVEKAAIEGAVERNNGNLSKTASELGISRTTLYRKLKEHGLSR
ncbi:MAG: sigma-54 dependent transcriptional regulator [Candidatus Neomarinimicrobiota bacterium]